MSENLMENRIDGAGLAASAAYAAALLADTEPDEGVISACEALWTALGDGEHFWQMSLYRLGHIDESPALRELAYVEDGQVILGSDVLPLYQIPLQIMEVDQCLAVHSSHCETWIPIRLGSVLTGVMVLTSLQRTTALSERDALTMAHILALGLIHLREVQDHKRTVQLLHAVTRLGHIISGSSGVRQLLKTFTDLTVRLLGFDRCTVFLYDPDGQTVTSAWYSALGEESRELEPPPALPQPAFTPQRLKTIPGIQVPVFQREVRVATVLVDNLFSNDPVPQGALEAVVDLTGQIGLALENLHLLERLQDSAIRDDLTKLYRAGYFHQTVSALLTEWQGDGQVGALLLIDVDHFKQVNDVYGHIVGDAALQQVASAISRRMDSVHIAARIGGDEFAVFMPDVDRDGATRRAAELQASFREQPILLPDGNFLDLTISVGIAVFPDDADAFVPLLQQSDQCMYRAKRRGRVLDRHAERSAEDMAT
ncbi:MAG: sensor domain-containing diguanylate cyclase [Firmicutes bacterium]|nr:sensor domain-containing diguanylate cyclase [Bacillota bacterium]